MCHFCKFLWHIKRGESLLVKIPLKLVYSFNLLLALMYNYTDLLRYALQELIYLDMATCVNYNDCTH